MKQLIKRIVKKGIGWYVDPLYRENEELRKDIQNLYAMLDEPIAKNMETAQNVHGKGPFAYSIVPPDGTRVWIYRAGDTGRLAARYLKECTGADLAGLIDDAIESTPEGDTTLTLEKAIEKINGSDWVLFCGDGTANSFTYPQLICKLRARGVTARILHFWDLDMRPMLRRVTSVGHDDRFISRLCAYEDFHDPDFIELSNKLTDGAIHRKVWEWVYIVRVLESYNCLRPGAKGLGFAVGTEPLPSYFASLGVKVLATDLNPEVEEAKSWIESNQHSGNTISALFKEQLCTRTEFEDNVSFRYVDMNALPDDLQGYDFCWSSCAIEHVGSLAQSKQFLKNMLRCLKPGGVAVHTTEFNLTSDVDTIEEGYSVLFRKKDIEEIREYFLELGCEMETSYFRGDARENGHVDIYPFRSPGAPHHINLVIDGYASTSFAIVVRKPF